MEHKPPILSKYDLKITFGYTGAKYFKLKHTQEVSVFNFFWDYSFLRNFNTTNLIFPERGYSGSNFARFIILGIYTFYR